MVVGLARPIPARLLVRSLAALVRRRRRRVVGVFLELVLVRVGVLEVEDLAVVGMLRAQDLVDRILVEVSWMLFRCGPEKAERGMVLS